MASDIIFRCPHCRQWLEAPPDTIGLFVECPKCEQVIPVPAKSDVYDATESPAAGKPLKSTEPDSSKSATIRINLPPNLGLPPPSPRRRFILRRP